jgi:hypothetical protein
MLIFTDAPLENSTFPSDLGNRRSELQRMIVNRRNMLLTLEQFACPLLHALRTSAFNGVAEAASPAAARELALRVRNPSSEKPAPTEGSMDELLPVTTLAPPGEKPNRKHMQPSILDLNPNNEHPEQSVNALLDMFCNFELVCG